MPVKFCNVVLEKDGEDHWTDRVKNGEVLQSQVWEEYAIKRRKASWIGHILRRNCILKRVIEGQIEGLGRRGIRRKQLLDYVKVKTEYRNLKAIDPALWRARFGRGYERVVRQTSEWMKTLKDSRIVDTEIYCFDCSRYVFGAVTKTDCQRYINSPVPVEPNFIVQFFTVSPCISIHYI
jgi:hypothetical protein